jgi:hypothetical protein
MQETILDVFKPTATSDSSILLSIVLPTKNRYEYLIPLVELLLESTSYDFEIVVQDNSDSNEPFLTRFGKSVESRISYQYVQGWLSVIDNCDIGVSRAKGEYVCLLGDDDGILIENSLELLRQLKERAIDAATVQPIFFTWPGTDHAVWKDKFTGLTSTSFSLSFTPMDARKSLSIVLDQGGSMGLQKLPRVYQSFVSRATLGKVRQFAGSCFPGPSPDMANAVALAYVVQNYVYVSIPTIISGQSPKSTGGQGARKQHHGTIESQPHLPADTAAKWSPSIPRFWSGATIYAESARRAVAAISGREEKFNYLYLYAACLVFERQYVREVMKVLLQPMSIVERLRASVYVPFYYLSISMTRILRFWMNLVGTKNHVDHSVKSIREAVYALKAKYKACEFFDFDSSRTK